MFFFSLSQITYLNTAFIRSIGDVKKVLRLVIEMLKSGKEKLIEKCTTIIDEDLKETKSLQWKVHRKTSFGHPFFCLKFKDPSKRCGVHNLSYFAETSPKNKTTCNIFKALNLNSGLYIFF